MISAKLWNAGVAAAVTALVLTGCGSAASPLSVISKAPTKTSDAKTAKLFEEMTLTPKAGAAAATPQHLTVDGAIDFATTKGNLTTKVAGQSIDAVLDGTVFYERIPGLSASTGKEWVKFDFATLGKLSGVKGLENLVQREGSSDPTSSLQQLRGVSGAVTKAGKEKIRGTDTTKYTATLDMNKAAANAPQKQQATIKQISDQFGITTVPVEVWVDSNGRVRRMHQVIDYSKAKSTPQVPADALPQTADLTVEYFEFGTPVSISVPLPNEVQDLADLLSKEQGGNTSGSSGNGNASTATSVAPSSATNSLVSRLISSVPAGFKQEADNVGDTGPSNLEKAAADDGEADAKDVLTRDGFVAGYQRLWTSGANQDNQIIDFVYQFKAAAGANDYLKRQVASAKSEGDAKEFAVDGIPGAIGLSHSASDGSAAVIVFTRGSFLSQVIVGGGDNPTGTVTSLAHQQFDKLA